METVAVVCDDDIECYEARDERQCSDKGKYDLACLGLAVAVSMFYVVLKLAWWFHYRHLPLDDEDEDEELMEEATEMGD